MTQFNIQGPYSPSCKINFAETNSRTAVFFQVFALPAVNNGIIHQGGWWRFSVVSRFCITEVRTVANGPLANSSSCQRRSNHQNIIGVSEERPKQRALSSIRESLSRVNAISLRYPVDRYRLLRPLSLSLYLSVYLSLSLLP